MANIPEYLSVSDLKSLLGLSARECAEIRIVSERMPIKIPRYYGELIRHTAALRAAVVPSAQEFDGGDREGNAIDAAEMLGSPIKGVVRRVQSTARLFPTLQCFGHCRFCFRGGNHVGPLTDAEIDAAIGYIEQQVAVREVLITGGDPLTLPRSTLGRILTDLHRCRHVEVIRIATRALAFMPTVFDKKMIALLGRHKPVYMTVSFIHPDELTPICVEKLNRLSDAGIVLLQQGPVLKGVNDDAEVLKELFEKLTTNRVIIHSAIYGVEAPGIRHFAVDLQGARRLFQDVERRTSGYCLPRLITLTPPVVTTSR